MANNNGKSSLFIGDLAIFCSEREIEEAFSPYGEIQEIKIMRSEETSRNLSYGFIKYSSAQAAKRAMTELNGVILCGRPLRIRWATYKSKLGSKEPKQDVLETSPVHVSFISYQIDKLVTEESLRELFSKYGLVVDASIKKSMIDTDVRRQSGYGFVHYSITGEGIHAAIRAASSLDDITVESVNYKCSLSHNLNKYLTGELSMPAEDSQIPGMPPSHQGQGQGGYQEDLGLADSDQFFHSPPQAQQSLYNVPMPPPGAGPHLYGNRPSQGPGQGQGQYQSQYGNQGGGLYQQQQTGPKYVSQVPLAARNRPPVVPQHGQGHGQGQGGRPRSMNGYQDLQNQLQQQQQQQQGGQYDPYDSMYDTRGDQQQQQYGRYDNNNSNQSHYKQQQGGQGQYGRQQYNAYDQHDRDMHSNNTNNNANQQLQGVFARGSLAQQRSSNNANTNSNPNTNNHNLLSAAVSGAYQQNRNSSVGGGVGGGNGYSVERPLPSGPPNAQQGQLRSGVAPYTANSTTNTSSNASVGASPRVVSAPSLMAASGQSGANSTTNRWSTGSYNVVPPAPVSGTSSHNSSSSNLRAPGINNNNNNSNMSGKPVGKYGMQGSNYPNNTNTSTNNAGYQQQYYNQYDNSNNNNTNYDLNANFNNMNMQQYGNVFQMSTPMYNTNMANMSNMSNMMHGNINLSPPPSPLIPNATFVASPLMGNATLFNPFQQGFSPLFATVQGQLSPYVAAAQMSPLMSPGMIPRDVVFEENISNVHNLFTPATYYASPVMALRDAHYSPAMFQGNFTTANAYPNNSNPNNNGGNGMQQGQGQGQVQGQGFDVRQYSNQRKAAQKTFPNTNTAHNNTNNNTTSPNTTNTTANPTNAIADTTSAEARTTEEAFFSSAAEGSPLEPECAVDTPTGIEDSTSASGVENASDGERESEGEVYASEIDCSDAATATTSETPLGSNSSSGESLGAPPGMSTAGTAGGAAAGGAGTESPNKALGSARRSMIMKHAKQLVA